MFSHESLIRVRYAETDQMGVVYHGHFFPYLESGRVEAMRSLGISYAEMEKMGISMPVVDVQAKYLRPAHYDDLLRIRTTLPELPLDHRIVFHQEVIRDPEQLLVKATIKLYFWNTASNQKTSMPQLLLERLKPYYLD